MKQYFDNNIDLKDEPKELKYTFNNNELLFKTNSGLFSKDEIDSYSEILLNNIEDDNYQSILDLGCGYGFLGICLSKKYNCLITFIDITERACKYTMENCRINSINNCTIIQSDGIKIKDKFDLITLNPPIHAGKEVTYRLCQEAFNSLNDNGCFYLVIHKKHGAKSMLEYLKTLTTNVTIEYKKKGLYVIKLVK